MKLTQNWVGYADRSYQQIKSSVLSRIIDHSPELTDHSESNPLIILVSIFAAIGEMLNLYIDRAAQEIFIGTAQRYTSLIRIAELLDYPIKARVPSSADIVFNLRDTQGNPVINNTGVSIVIPALTVLDSPAGSFVLQEAVAIVPNQTSTRGRAKQYSQVASDILGISTGDPFQMFPLPDDYAHKSLNITVGTDVYKEYDSLSFMGYDTLGFIVRVLEDGANYVVFGDNFTGQVPPSNENITYTYKSTNGADGNTLANTITMDASSISGLPVGATLVAVNPGQSSGGSEIEGLADIRLRAPGVISTKYRAVTKTDYRDIALQVPGVGHAKVDYCCCEDCASLVKLYIAPTTRGIASQILLDETELYFDDKAIVGRQVVALPAGISRLFLRAIITGTPGYTAESILSDVYQLLWYNYSFNVSDINNLYRPSEIIARLERLNSVDSVSIEKIYLEPYARPIGDDDSPLSITFTEIKATTEYNYRVRAIDDGFNNISFNLERNGEYQATLLPGVPYNSLDLSNNLITTITITNPFSLYNDGDIWDFTIYPTYPESFSNYQLQITDNVIGIIDVDYNNLLPNGLPTVFGDYSVILGNLNTENCKGDC